MSASHLVDLGNTCQLSLSIGPANGVGASPASGVIVGEIVDLQHANSYCNLLVAGGPSTSGSFRVLVQTADVTTSGSFTDPTSGLASPPGALQSGGVLIVNSGSQAGSGILAAAGFVRNGRYARAIVMSGDQFNAPVTAGFVSQLRTIGSGGGFTYAPGSGVVSV